MWMVVGGREKGALGKLKENTCNVFAFLTSVCVFFIMVEL